jgi:hypothetical protein
MRVRVATCIALAALAAASPAALARSPLKPADMKTIRKDARAKAASLATAYSARDFKVTCAQTSRYSVRCRLQMTAAKPRSGSTRRDCAVTAVYVVTRDKKIAGSFVRNACG